MDVVHTTRYAPLTVEVASECVAVISHFQTLFIAFIENTATLPFGYLIALCNNSTRSYECVSGLTHTLQSTRHLAPHQSLSQVYGRILREQGRRCA